MGIDKINVDKCSGGEICNIIRLFNVFWSTNVVKLVNNILINYGQMMMLIFICCSQYVIKMIFFEKFKIMTNKINVSNVTIFLNMSINAIWFLISCFILSLFNSEDNYIIFFQMFLLVIIVPFLLLFIGRWPYLIIC